MNRCYRADPSLDAESVVLGVRMAACVCVAARLELLVISRGLTLSRGNVVRLSFGIWCFWLSGASLLSVLPRPLVPDVLRCFAWTMTRRMRRPAWRRLGSVGLLGQPSRTCGSAAAAHRASRACRAASASGACSRSASWSFAAFAAGWCSRAAWSSAVIAAGAAAALGARRFAAALGAVRGAVSRGASRVSPSSVS